MAGGSNKHVDEPLERVLVYQGPQTKSMQFYVPLTEFAVECVALLVFFRFFQFWALLFVLPIHLLLMLKTASDQWWVENLVCNIKYRYFARNKGLRGKNVVTFTPHATRRELRAELGPQLKTKRRKHAQ